MGAVFTDDCSTVTGIVSTTGTVSSVSGTWRGSTASNDHKFRDLTNVGVQDMYASCDLIMGASDPGGPFWSLRIRQNTGNEDCIGVQMSGDYTQFRIIAGPEAVIAGPFASGITLSATFRILLSAYGNTIRLYRNGTEIWSGRDTRGTVGTYAGGGFYQTAADLSLLKVDNFEGGRVDAPVVVPRSLRPPGRQSPGSFGQSWQLLGQTITVSNVNATAEVATGTGSAPDPLPSLAPNAGNAAGTGAAANPSPALAPNAGAASGTGAALAASNPTVSAAAGGASGTGSAGAPLPSVAPNAGNASGTGSAPTATVTVNTGATGLASGTGSAPSPKPSLAIAGLSSSTGTGAAPNPAASLAPHGGVGTGTGSSGASSSAVSPTAGVATGTGSALQASATETTITNAPAGLASGTGAANGATTTLAPHGGAGSGTGAAGAGSSKVSPTAGLASGSGAANNATTTLSKNAAAGVASGTGAAHDAAATSSPTARAGVATGTGSAFPATAQEEINHTPGIDPIFDYVPALGCVSEYDFFITDRSGAIDLVQLPWSGGNWSRVLDGLGTADVDVPDALGGLSCCSGLDGLRPWRYGLRVVRDGRSVFKGPIVDIDRPPVAAGKDGSYKISAIDKMGWTQKRAVRNDIDFSGEDAGVAFKQLIEDAVSLDNEFGLFCPDFTTGITYQRDYKALDFEYAWDVLQELAKSAVDWTMLAGDLYVWDTSGPGWRTIKGGVQTYLVNSVAPTSIANLGILTDLHFDERPGWHLGGMEQANSIFELGADSGEQGFRKYWTASDVDLDDGLLDFVEPNSQYRPAPNDPLLYDGAFQARADSVLAMRKATPITYEGGALSEHFPLPLERIIPGAWATLDYTGVCPIPGQNIVRLKRIDVQVSAGDTGLTETVVPTFIPLGTEEEA